MPRPGSELVAVTFGAADPVNLARFWADGLGWEVGGTADRRVELVPTDGTAVTLRFEPLAPDQTSRKRIHLELTTTSDGDQQRTAAELVGLGGRHIDLGQKPEEGHLVLADPEGNELCIIGPTNRFLGECPRFGCINGDGNRATGVFWSQALGYPFTWDQDGETAIRNPDGTGPMLSWGGPPLNPKPGRNRLRPALAIRPGIDPAAELARLVALGATITTEAPGRADLQDPDANDLILEW